MNEDFLIERRLMKISPELHQRTKDSAFVLQNMLESYLPRFPDFTDHSILHSMDVLDFCNKLVGVDQAEKLSAAECYVLIMGCYLHDIGMGVNAKDYELFSKEIDFGDYLLTHSLDDARNVTRAFHNEYSGLFIRKYASLFDIPCEEMLFAIIQVSRGHRKTDLYDDKEYPNLTSEYGVIRTAYLAALVRLADEIDVASDRNPELLFDTSKYSDPISKREFGKHESIRRVEIEDDRIVLLTKPKSPEFVPLIEELAGKIQKTLDYCRDVVEKRTEFHITQSKIAILPWEE
ncbi:MAG: hypothetical protein IJ788_04185 [Oscillospiraceae bacterium]|nr:hypothetical protein [Oscillospiraceae bacterium]